MILNYRFENIMSFRDNVEFSMLAPKTKVKSRFPNNFITSDSGIDVLKTAVIVGENAGGKSNFVRSLSYFQSFFREISNDYVIDKKYYDIRISSTKYEWDKLGRKGSNINEFFEVISSFNT